MHDSIFLHKRSSEMYRSCPKVRYEGCDMYMAKVTLLNGETHEIPFTCSDGVTPYKFVIEFVTVHLWGTREVKLIELFQDNVYQESYVPKTGWFKKGKEVDKV